MDVDYHDDLMREQSYERRKSKVASIRIGRPSIISVPPEDTPFCYQYEPKKTGKFMKPIQKFCTGSKYFGEWNPLGFCGKGLYKFPHGVIYDGEFNRSGEFHGRGALIYPNGSKLEGLWCKGKLVGEPNQFDEIGDVKGDDYCKMPDRRFQLEIHEGLNPAGQELLTKDDNPPKEIPQDSFDMGLGFYNPNFRCISDYERKEITIFSECMKVLDHTILADLEEIRRESSIYEIMLRQPKDQKISHIPLEMMERWIYKNSRKAWDEPTGYRPGLYEHWTYGLKMDEFTASLSQRLLIEKMLVRQTEEVEEIVAQSLPQILRYNVPKRQNVPTLLQSISKLFGKEKVIRASELVSDDDTPKSSGVRRLSPLLGIDDDTSSTHELIRISNLFGIVPKSDIEDDYYNIHEEIGPVCRLRVGFRTTMLEEDAEELANSYYPPIQDQWPSSGDESTGTESDA